MRVRFIGGPASGQIYDVPDTTYTITVPEWNYLHSAFHEDSHEIGNLLPYKVAHYDLDHAIIDGEEWNVFIYRSSG